MDNSTGSASEQSSLSVTEKDLSFIDKDLESFTEKDLESEESLRILYEKWRRYYNVTRGEDEIEKRLQVFKDNAKYVKKFNKKKGRSYTVGLNQFSDITHEEFCSTYCGGCVPEEEAVTPVKDQGECSEP